MINNKFTIHYLQTRVKPICNNYYINELDKADDDLEVGSETIMLNKVTKSN